MKRFILSVLFIGSISTAFAQTATLAVKTSTKYQHIDGFGGTGMNGQWGDVYNQAKVNMLWGKGDDQIGLNIMRIRINPNEGNWGEYGNPIKWARAVNPDLQVFATPWTPPKKYKTDFNGVKAQNDFGTWVWPIVEHSWGGEGSNGGKINPAYYEQYANFLERYRATMENKGCPIDMISIQNECDYTPTATDDGVEHASYESCIYSPKEMAAMVKAARAHINAKCKVMGPETFGWGQSNYNKTLMNMQDALDNIDVWGNHLYGSNDWTYINTVTAKTKKPMWMTEFLIDIPKTGWTWDEECKMIESLEDAMKNGYNAYIYYNMINDFFECANGGSASKLFKRAYVFSHYAKYATGKTRVSSTLNSTNTAIKGGSAYVSESGDTVTVFVNNPTSSDYKITFSLPFVPAAAQQICTNEVVNAKRTDISDKLTGTTRPNFQLKAKTFYTFQFLKTAVDNPEEMQIVESPKAYGKMSPVIPYQFMADPTAIEHEGRLYVYCTDDQQEYDYAQGMAVNTYGHITRLVCMSTADMVNWTNHGTIDVKQVCPWISTSWAPSIVSREEADGKTHFYMYFTNSAAGIGVMTATSPLGPWTDPLGHALIDSKTEGIGKMSNIIDPGAVIDDNGTGWLAFGGGGPSSITTTVLPGNARIVKLNDDMISFDKENIAEIPAPFHFEANELNMLNGSFCYSYCTCWGTNDADWKTYPKRGTKSTPAAASIQYMISTDPLSGNWTYKGELLANPGAGGYPYGNNHSHLQLFGSKYYIMYHTQAIERSMGVSGGYRNLAMSTMTARGTTLLDVTPSDQNATQIPTMRPNACEVNDAEMSHNASAIKVENYGATGNTVVVPIAGGWICTKGSSFPTAGDEKSFVANVQGCGTMEVKFGAIDAEPIAIVKFDCAEMSAVAVDLLYANESDLNDVYIVFTEAKGVKFDSWQFSTLSAEEVTAINDVRSDEEIVMSGRNIYNVAGQKLNAPRRGVNIINGKKVIVR